MYEKLFSKGRINGCVIPNRVVLSPMDDTLGQASGEISPPRDRILRGKGKRRLRPRYRRLHRSCRP